jgi:hypothetical protein
LEQKRCNTQKVMRLAYAQARQLDGSWVWLLGLSAVNAALEKTCSKWSRFAAMRESGVEVG